MQRRSRWVRRPTKKPTYASETLRLWRMPLILLSFLLFPGSPAVAQVLPSKAEVHLNHLRSEAIAGNLRAQIEMGLALESGPEADPVEAARWFLAAANQGNPEAQTDIGYLYSVGSGVPRDPEKAFMWFQRAAAEGYAPAQTDVGTMLAKGDGVKQDLPAAVNWYRRAAAVGFAPAENLPWHRLCDREGYRAE